MWHVVIYEFDLISFLALIDTALRAAKPELELTTHTHTQATSYLIACSHIRIAYLLQVARCLLPLPAPAQPSHMEM